MLWKMETSMDMLRRKMGCRAMYSFKHHGPLLEDLKNYYLPYRYPDIRYQFTFKRIISDRWAEYIQQFLYDEKKVRYICKNFFLQSFIF